MSTNSPPVVIPFIGANKMVEGTLQTNYVGIGIQLALGVLITYCIYMISMVVMKEDMLSIDSKFDLGKKTKIVIVNGYADSSQYSGDRGMFNTSVPSAYDYIPIVPSVNLRGGAQFSYSMWLYVGTTTENHAHKCIFLKGDPQKYSYTIRNNHTNVDRKVTDRIAFCPMLCFGSNPLEFTVYFNTMHNIKEELQVRRLESSNTAVRHNMLSLFSDKWMLITITFEDNIPINDFENGILVKFWINDTLYQTGRYPSALKQNQGRLHTFPDGSLAMVRFSNMTYFNYCASDEDISTMYSKGPSDKPAESVTKSFISPTFISDYNRLDIYNT